MLSLNDLPGYCGYEDGQLRSAKLAELKPWIGEIAKMLLGEPNKERSTETDLRFGTNGSVSVIVAGPRIGSYYNHETNKGGGLLELIQFEGRAVPLNRHSPDSESVGRDPPSLRAPRQQNSLAADWVTAKKQSGWPRGARTRCVAFIKAHLCCRRLPHLSRFPDHAGAGGARNRAISDRISWNIRRGTATSDI